jgi:hypothetical protein
MAAEAAAQPASAIGSTSVWREGLFWLALALSLGRFWQLSQWSLWEDEVFTLNDSRALLAGEWSKNPLGYAPFAALIQLLGPVPSAAALRMIPALLGCLGIAAVGALFAPVFGARRAAACALLVSASSWHLYWSQNARAYTLTQDLALFAGALALAAVFGAASTRRAWAAALFGVLACLVHPSAALFCLGVVGALFLLPFVGFSGALRPMPPLPRNVLRIGALLGVLAALWLGRMWWDYFRAKSDSTALHLIKTSGWYFTPALLAAATFGAFGAWRERAARDVLVALACLLAAALAIANALFVRAAAQYLFVLLPFVALLATRPLVLRNAGPRWRAAWLVALVLPALADQGLYFFQRNGDRPPWKEAFEQVINTRLPGDLVFTNCANVGEFYFEPRSLNLRRPVHVQILDPYTSATEMHWARQARRAWFVNNVERLSEWDHDSQRSLKTMLKEDARLVASFEVGEGLRDLNVLVYLRE